ncbi:MAG: hypothetical protein L6R37_005926 [Teloschistes peruensis]|nr:MAG: hypothetical protein L6R37_005926 [Teloschistes peruensis]
MRFGVTCLTSIFLGFLWCPASAIYADEAYHVDFHHVLLGHPQPRSTFLHRPSASSKASLLYTFSDRSVIGAINPKDGSVVWRQQLNPGNGLLKALDGDSILISAVNGAVQAWDAAEGRLLWDWSISGQIKALEVVKSHDLGRTVFLAIKEERSTKAVICMLAGDSGAVVWEYEDESGDIPLSLTSTEAGLFYISIHSGLLQASKIKVTPLEPSTGRALSSIILNADKDVIDHNLIIPPSLSSAYPLLLWSDRTRRSLRINVLGSSHVITTRLASEQAKNIDNIRIHTSSRIGKTVNVLIECQSGDLHWSEAYQLDVPSEILKKTYQLPTLQGPAAYSVAVHSGIAYYVRNTKQDVTLFSSLSDRAVGRWPLQSKGHDHLIKSEGIRCAISEVVVRGASTFAVRSAILLTSGDWKLIHNGEESWFRPESLSGVVAAAWADTDGPQSLADELAAESHGSIATAYMHRLKRHANDLRNFPQWATSLPQRIINNLQGHERRTQHLDLARDGFGFRKIVVGATDSGRLFALQAGVQGKIIWNIQASKVEPGQQWPVRRIEINHDIAQVHILGGGFMKVNISHGSVIDHRPKSAEQSYKITVGLLDSTVSSVSVGINSDGTVELPEPISPKPKTIIVTQDEQMTVRGWTVGVSKAALAWTFSLQPNEKVVSLASRPSKDPIASIGKALGDRNVLYKFLSPNILIIGTVAADTSMASFYVLDSVSGQLVHTQTHPNVDATQPISSVVSENWFAYSVFSELAETDDTSPSVTRGYQIVMSELFESLLPNDRGVRGSAVNSSSLRPVGVDGDGRSESPYVVSQTYLVPAAISFMTVTSTLHGITPRSLLCIVPSLNSVIAIPRAFTDPRRPVGRDAIAAEAEEGLFRHNAVLEYNPKWALNHVREVLGIRQVITSPSLLESTSLVFAFGTLDMFGTRVAPIGGFDILGKGFNKIQLVGTVAALAVGTGILAPLVSSKETFNYLSQQKHL